MNSKVDIEFHLRAFAEAFVLESRKEKWVDMLSERPDSIISQAAKLFNYLEHNYIEQNDALECVAADDVIGVFYDFSDEPKCISFNEAVEVIKVRDAIFSITPGKLAIYFYHEGWNFVCKR